MASKTVPAKKKPTPATDNKEPVVTILKKSCRSACKNDPLGGVIGIEY